MPQSMNNPRPDAVSSGNPPMSQPDIAARYRALAAVFRAHGLEMPELDARLLVCHACGLTHEQFVAAPDRPIDPQEARRLEGYTGRRLAREPVSRILGHREFRGLRFTVAPRTLDPRADTETVVDAVVEIAAGLKTTAPAILDLGTGTGCILAGVLHQLAGATGVGVDLDPEAVRTARANAVRLGVGARAEFFCGSWLDALSGRFDIVVSNPPYIRAGDIEALEPEVARYDPRLALDGGDDGLTAYRRICAGLATVVRPGGWVVFETGSGQDGAVLEIMRQQGLVCEAANARRWRDLAGRVRCVAARIPERRG